MDKEKLKQVLDEIYGRIYRIELENILRSWDESKTAELLTRLLLSEVEFRLESLKSRHSLSEELEKELKEILLAEAEARYNWYSVVLGIQDEDEQEEQGASPEQATEAGEATEATPAEQVA